MAVSPQSIRSTTFKTTRRGYDQEEVNSFVSEVADALESAQHEATAMEARARAAVARLQELSKSPEGTADVAQPDAAARPAGAPSSAARVEESETISRAILLAQRTADAAVADAQAEAARLTAAAHDEAAAQLDAARRQAAQLVDDAKAEARRAGESERVRVEGEVQALLARRDFLVADVDQLEQFLAAQRERLTEAAAQLGDMVQRIPGGLAEMRRPLLSAAEGDHPDDDRSDDIAKPDAEAVETSDDADDADDSGIAEITRVAAASTPTDESGAEAEPGAAGTERASLFDTSAVAAKDATAQIDVVDPWGGERR